MPPNILASCIQVYLSLANRVDGKEYVQAVLH